MIKKNKKIAVIGLKGLPAFGGAAKVGESLIEELTNDFEFTVLSVQSHTTQKVNSQNEAYNQIFFKKFGKGGINTFVYTIKCMFHCLFNKYDLIHVHHASSGFITPFLRIKNKVIVTFHGVHKSKDPKFSYLHFQFFKFSEWLNLKFANEIVSVSKTDCDYILKKYKQHILYIPNGIKLKNNNDEISNNKNKLNSSKYILFSAARIYQIKGLHLVLKAFHKLNLNRELKVVGDLNHVPKYHTEIIKLANGLNISFIDLIKNRNDLFEVISNAELFIFPSTTEAMSMMLLEVASLGTPIIASDIDANTSIFSNKEVLFFKSEDEDDLAKKIQFAIDNKILMKDRSINAYNKLIKDYNWTSISEKYKTIFLLHLN